MRYGIQPFECFIGFRYLKTKQKDGFVSLITLLSVGGVSLGVMALIIVISVMAGFETDIKSRILSVESHVLVEPETGSMPADQSQMDRLTAYPQVASAFPYVRMQALIKSDYTMSGTVVTGIPPSMDQIAIFQMRGQGLAAPSQVPKGDRPLPGIILGKSLARQLGIFENDTVWLISPRGTIAPSGHVPTMKRFRVTGLFESGMYEYDNVMAFTAIDTLQQMMRMPGMLSGIAIRLKDMDDTARFVRELRATWTSPLRVTGWMDRNRNFFSALQLEKMMMFVILALIVAVAAFNITSSLTMMVMQKKKEIAILKGMGATRKSILNIFMIKGTSIGLIGTTIGGIIGIVLCLLLKRYEFIHLPADVYYLNTLPVRIQTLDVLTIILAAVGICLLATFFPAKLASSLVPSEAFRDG